MAEQLLGATFNSPAFLGVNTQESSVELSVQYATKAQNGIIDKFGRLGTRKGWLKAHSTSAGANFKALGELVVADGTSYIIGAAGNKLYKLMGTTLTELTYSGGGTAPTITNDYWQMAQLNDHLYLYQVGHDPLVFDPAVSTTGYVKLTDIPTHSGTVQKASCVITAYGRTWTGLKSNIQFSDLLNGANLATGTSGSLDISKIWAYGSDEIVALGSHNKSLIIFGTRQILIYTGADNPSTMSLQDTIVGVGCVARDSVASTGSDLIFLSDTGVRALSRTIQEKSAPMRDISINVSDDLRTSLEGVDKKTVAAVYSGVESFYLLSIPSMNTTWCFDMRGTTQNGGARVTSWSSINPLCFLYAKDQTLYIGKENYIGKYTGYTDNGAPYRWKYVTTYFDFQKPTNLKILKKFGVSIINGYSQTLVLKFGFDYQAPRTAYTINIPSNISAEYGIDEFNVGEFSKAVLSNYQDIQVGGAGSTIQFSLESTIDGTPISVQKINLYAKEGKML